MTAHIDPAELAQAKLRQEIFAEVANAYQRPTLLADGVAHIYLGVSTRLEELCIKYPAVMDNDQISHLLEILKVDHTLSSDTQSHDLVRKTNLQLNTLYEWLSTGPEAGVFTTDELHIFLQLSRTGRRHFQAKGYNPEHFIQGKHFELAFVLHMALSGFRLSLPRQPASS